MATTKKAVKPVTKAPAAKVETKKNLPVATKSKLPANIAEFESGEGFENVSASDVLLPRLTLIQSTSDQVKKSKPVYIKDANVGDFCDTAINKILPNPLPLIPCFYAMVYLQWGPRNSDRGLVMNHGTDPSILKKTKRDEDNKNVLSNGDYIAETATYFVLYQNEDSDWIQAFLPMASTQLKASKRWMSLLKAEKLERPDGSKFIPSMYYRTWIASGVEQSNAKGDWIGWTFEPGEPINDIDPTKELLAVAKEFCHQAKIGLVRGDVEGAVREQNETENDGTM